VFLSPLTNTPANAESIETQLNLQIASILALAVDSCDVSDPNGVTTVNITPNAGGNSQSNQCQNVSISTNASGGYELSIETSSSTLNHNPVLVPQATIASIGTTPTALTSDTWGLAIPKTNNDGKQPGAANLVASFVSDFDATYANETNLPSSTAKYRNVPLSSTKFAETDTYSSATDDYTLYFAANVPATKPSGIYQTTITYTGTAIDLEPPVPVVIVPDVASTISPCGDGTGSSGVLDNGPQFSLAAVSDIDFGSSPTVTIGGKACTDVIVNSAGTAITCSGPTSGMSAGEKKVLVNGQETTAVVTYDSTNYPTLQSLTGGSGTCLGTGATPVIYRDARDSQLYYVAKLADGKCWMLDNLKYKPNGDTSGTNQPGFIAQQVANTGVTNLLTVDGTDVGTTDQTTDNLDVGKYIDPISVAYCYGNINISPENITKCGLLYNFYTANAGTLAYTDITNGIQSAGSICPANWRLPTATSTTTGPGNGTSYNYGDFAVLNASMNQGALTTPGFTTGTTGFYENWHPTGPWRGVFGGVYITDFVNQGASGNYWASSLGTAAGGRRMGFNSSIVYPGNGIYDRYNGYAVRCVN